MNEPNNASWMDAILNALRSPGAMMVALVLALFPQGEHTAQVFMYFSHDRSGNAQFFAYAFAAAVEVAVLLFVLAGHKRISYLFAGASFLTNVVYYAIGGVAILSVAAFPVLLLSALLPACIMGYSHTIAEKPKSAATAVPAKGAPTRRRWQFWRKPAEAPTTPAAPTYTTTTPIATPAQSGGHSEGVSVAPEPAERAGETSGARKAAPKSPRPRKPAKPASKPTRDQRRALIAEWQLQSAKQVMESFNVGKRTADEDIAWVRKNAMHANGVAK